MITYKYQENEFEVVKKLVLLESALQKNAEYKLADSEIIFLSHIICKYFNGANPFSGETRKDIMNIMGYKHSSMFSGMLDKLVMKKIIVKKGRAKYELNKPFIDIATVMQKKLYHRMPDGVIKFSIELRVDEEQTLQT